MELALALQEASQIRVTCDDHYSHSADLHPLLTENASSILDDPATYGKKLYATLFPSQSIAHQALATMPERLLIVTSEPLLDAIPWEYIYGPFGVDDPTAPDYTENFLVLECRFVRGLLPAQRIPAPSLNQSLHIIAIPSNPLSETLHPLAIEEEWTRLKESIQPLSLAITLERTVPPTLERVRHLVANQKNRVVHFMGHGGQDQQQGALLYFEHDNGALHLVAAKEFMQRVRGTLFLVTLNACVSATPGPTSFHNLAAVLVKQRTPYALGMRFSILDEDARTFSRVFYSELARGVPVEEALFQSRLTLAQSRRLWVIGVPVLYTSLAEPAPGFVGHDGIPNINESQPHVDVSALPPIEGTFQGRINDLIILGTALTGDQRPRILTILGSGGQGKTALALKLVERFVFAWSGGVWARSLEIVPNRASFVIALAQFLGIETQHILDPAEIERQVLARLNERRMLLVLDNAETLVEAIEAQNADAFDLVAFLKKLLMTAVSLLVTSRVSLGWDDEQTRELGGLSPQEGAALFRQGVPQRRHEIDLSVAASLSRQLEGHPLGLRLLAGTFNEIKLSLPAFLQTTEERLQEAENKYVGPEHRHRKLYACIETSVRALNPALRSLLSGLWIFHAPFLEDTVVNIFDPDVEETEQRKSPVRDQLYQLQRRSLLTRKMVTTRDGALQLYALLPTTRPYVEHHLEQTYNRDILKKRLIMAYSQLARFAYDELDRSAAVVAFVQEGREDFEWVCEAFADETIVIDGRGRYLGYWGWVVFRLGNPQRGLRLLEQAKEIVEGTDTDLELLISNNMAVMYAGMGQPERALQIYEEALPIRRAVGDRAGEASTLNNMSLVYYNTGKLKKALQVYGEALLITRAIGNRMGEAATLANMADVYHRMGQSEKALHVYGEALPILRAVGNRAGEAATLNGLAKVYYGIGKSDKALQVYEEALLIMRAIGNRAGEATNLNNMADVYYGIGRSYEALQLYEKALPIMRAVGDRAGEATTLNGQAKVYYRVGKSGEALYVYEEALSIVQVAGDRVGEAETLKNMADVYGGTGQPEKALQIYEEALSIMRVVGYRAGEAATLNNIGLVYYRTGQLEEALQIYEEALPITRAVGDRAGEAATLNNIGLVYYRTGQLEEALQIYEEALPITRAVGDLTGEATTINNMAEVYRMIELPEKALQMFEEALLITRAVGDRAGEAAMLNNMAEMYRMIELPEKALQIYEEALPIMRAVGDRVGEAITLNNIAGVYHKVGQLAKALQMYEEALLIMQRVGDRAGEATTLNNIASLYQSLQRYSDALTAFEQSLILSQQIISPSGEIVGLIGLAALLYLHLNRPADAIASLEQALQIFATTGLPQDAAGQKVELVHQLLAEIRGETSSDALSTFPTEVIQQIIATTVVVMTVSPWHRPEWIESVTNVLQDAQQQGADWQQERDFYTAILAILDGQSPTLPPDHPYAQAIEAIQQGIAQTGEETL